MIKIDKKKSAFTKGKFENECVLVDFKGVQTSNLYKKISKHALKQKYQ